MTDLNTTILPLPSSSSRSLSLIMLLCDTPIDSVRYTYGNYHTIFSKLFQNSLTSIESDSTTIGKEKETEKCLTITSFDVVNSLYPTEIQIKAADGILITGSASSAYTSLPWITTLVTFVSSLPTLKPNLKLIGICFGHQIIARSFGSKVEVNEIGGWEVGVRKMELTKRGREIFGGEVLAIHQMHRDHVPSIPSGFESLGSTPACGIHGMIKLSTTTNDNEESTKFDPTRIEIITLQGHPEFSPDIVTRIVDFRTQGGVFTTEEAELNRGYAKERDEGIRIGRVLLSILGVEG